jgi:hypothetical protein
MAVKLEDLDQLLGYDPATHSVAGLPSIAKPSALQPSAKELGSHPATMPSVAPAQSSPAPGAMPDVMPTPGTASPSAGIPSIDAGASPDLAKPKQSVWSKLGHGLEKGAEVAGDVLAPGVTAMIPGTQLNKEREANQETKREGEQASTGFKQAETAAEWKNLNKPEEPKLAQNPIELFQQDPEKFKQYQQLTASQEKAGDPVKEVKQDDQGNEIAVLASGKTMPLGFKGPATAPGKLTGVGSEIVAQIGNPPSPADYPGGEKDPQYISANKKWGQDAESIKNQEAGAQGAARGAGYNASRPVQVLVPQPDGTSSSVWMTAAQAEGGGFSTAAQGTRALSATAQMNDIVNASQNVRKAIQAGGASNFNPAQVAKITLAMHETDPGVLSNEIANIAASGLTPQQQDLVTWLYQLDERALSLRNVAGMGQGSDTTRAAILRALPSIFSGSPEMATKQLDAFDNMVGNLRKGILSVKGADTQPPSGEPQRPSNVPPNYQFNAKGPKGAGWYRPQ